jgi:hypothetical protein
VPAAVAAESRARATRHASPARVIVADRLVHVGCYCSYGSAIVRVLLKAPDSIATTVSVALYPAYSTGAEKPP